MDKSRSPLVSVIIPAYNAAGFIEGTLDSVLSQTYRNIEVLVVDDGSRDETAEIVSSISEHDHRVILVRQPNSGVAAARNRGIRKSKGEFIAPIDADDIWYPQNIEKQVDCVVQADESVGVVYAWSVDIDEEGFLTGGFRASPIEGDVYPTLLSHYFLGNASASLIRRACFEKVGYYSSTFKQRNAQGCEDWDLYLRIAEHYQFRVVPEFLVGYRRVTNSMSRGYASMARSHSFLLESLKRKHVPIPAIIYRLSLVNLYIYFAHQCSRSNSHEDTIYWLQRALRSNLLTALLSYRLYTLLGKILLRAIRGPLTYRNWRGRRSQEGKKGQSGPSQRFTTLSPLSQKRLTLRLTVLIWNLYHRVILMVSKHRQYRG